MHIASFNLIPGFHLDKEALIASFLTKEVNIPDEYLDFTNIFLEEKVLVQPECTKLNEHPINLKDGKQLPYRPIYSLGPVKLENLKIYIEIYLKIGFIWPSKSLANVSIFFNKKLDGSFCLCVNYRGFNNLIIKNQYPLPLIGESFNRLGQAKRFTELDLISTYHQMRIKKAITGK